MLGGSDQVFPSLHMPYYTNLSECHLFCNFRFLFLAPAMPDGKLLIGTYVL